MNLLEELVYHTVLAGHAFDAFEVYTGLMGGSFHLCWRIAEYERGIRICRVFTITQAAAAYAFMASAELPACAVVVLRNDFAQFLRGVGRLAQAASCYRENAKQSDAVQDVDRCVSLQNLTEVLVESGRLAEASEISQEAIDLSFFVRWEEEADCRLQYAQILGLRGMIQSATAEIRLAKRLPASGDLFYPRLDREGYCLWSAQFLLRCGRKDEAAAVAESERIEEHLELRPLLALICALDLPYRS